jgi:hypothetical protein
VGRRATIAAWAALAVAAVAGCDAAEAMRHVVTETGAGAARNTERADYVGPAVCGECHAENHATWRAGLHAVMTAPAGPATVKGDFTGATVRYGDGHARFEPGYVMTLAGAEIRRFRVTRTIGSRAMQEYVGVEIGGDGTEIRLPWGYWIARPGWYPQPYFDSWFPAEYAGDTPQFDPYFPDPTPWAARCAWCHNTVPFGVRLARGVGRGLLELYTTAAPVGAETAGDLVTEGISCESCHLGGRAHADGAPIAFVPHGPGIAPRPGVALAGRGDPATVNAICGQCHSTPAPRYPDGAAARNSSEALDLDAGACAGIACTDCHDPHVAGPGAGAADDPADLAACARCHPAIGGDHARHAAADASCLDCHMPRVVQGIAAVVRSHRISSPGNPAMLGADGVNACNLCHLDRSVAWTVAELGRGWGITGLPAGGDARPAGVAWLASAHGAIRIAAAHALARRDGRAAVPRLVRVLDDPVAFYRMWTLLAIEAALGRRLAPAEYDPLAPPARRAAQTRALFARPPR